MKFAFDMSRYSIVTEDQYEEYADYVNKTAKMLFGTKPGKLVPEVCKNPMGYMQVHRIFTNEGWTLERIIRSYNNAMKESGTMPSDVYWWWQRKKVNEKKAPELG